MESALRRGRQLISQGPKNLLWLGFVLGIAPWGHRAAGPLHSLRRLQVRRHRQTHLEQRIDLLRSRVSRGDFTAGGPRVALADLSPELDEICRPLRRPGHEIPLADIDQDGFLCPRLGKLWDSPRVDADSFLPRTRFDLTVVDRDGVIGVHKNFRGDRAAFADELEATLDLGGAGCHVPAVLAVDFGPPGITFGYINGVVVREALAEAGAPMRDRDVVDRPSRLGHRIQCRRMEEQRIAAGRRLIDSVLDKESIARIADGLLAIHRANYVLEDIKYGNIIIEAKTKVPYFIDCERALPLHYFSRSIAADFRDRDAAKLNRLFGTKLLTATALRRMPRPPNSAVYAPFYAGAGVRWGAIWNPDMGIQRWRHVLAAHVPVPRGGRVLDLGANNGFNALQMLRAGAAEAIAVEIDPTAIEQGLFVKRIFEWADNAEYRFSYVRGSHGDVASMNLGRFDLITAFCTLYYLSAEAMAKTVSDLARMTDTLVLQCNDERWIDRGDPATFIKAALSFNIDLVRNNGFPHVTVVERRGSSRPLVIARTKAAATEEVSANRTVVAPTPSQPVQWITSAPANLLDKAPN
jgi:tRNA A-37 threonylcarbamoyl transferase component Bud32